MKSCKLLVHAAVRCSRVFQRFILRAHIFFISSMARPIVSLLITGEGSFYSDVRVVPI